MFDSTFLASEVTKTPLTISISNKYENAEKLEDAFHILPGIKVFRMTETKFVADMKKYGRFRACSGKLSDDIYYNEAGVLGLHIVSEKPIANGRFELLHYLKEQSISYEYHSYGSVFC